MIQPIYGEPRLCFAAASLAALTIGIRKCNRRSEGGMSPASFLHVATMVGCGTLPLWQACCWSPSVQPFWSHQLLQKSPVHCSHVLGVLQRCFQRWSKNLSAEVHSQLAGFSTTLFAHDADLCIQPKDAFSCSDHSSSPAC